MNARLIKRAPAPVGREAPRESFLASSSGGADVSRLEERFGQMRVNDEATTAGVANIPRLPLREQRQQRQDERLRRAAYNQLQGSASEKDQRELQQAVAELDRFDGIFGLFGPLVEEWQLGTPDEQAALLQLRRREERQLIQALRQDILEGGLEENAEEPQASHSITLQIPVQMDDPNRFLKIGYNEAVNHLRDLLAGRMAWAQLHDLPIRDNDWQIRAQAKEARKAFREVQRAYHEARERLAQLVNHMENRAADGDD